jgi:hypothetical protein
MLAVALSLGGGAYASTVAVGSGHGVSHPGNAPAVTRVVQADSQAATASGVSWATLSPVNGWTSENPVVQTGNPRVAIQNGIVYLSGSLAQPTPGNDIFATLPLSFRPAHNLYITVYTSTGTQGSLYIGHDGTTEAFSSGTCGSRTNAQCFTSLAAVSYPINS